jgi:hypothetical protein
LSLNPYSVERCCRSFESSVFCRIDPKLFGAPSHHLPELQRSSSADREKLRSYQLPAQGHFEQAIRNHARTHGLALPIGREDEFLAWIYANPARCPGLRFNHEVFRAFTANFGDTPEAADFTDLG